MGLNSSSHLPEDEMKSIMKQSGFTKGQVLHLYNRFNELDTRKMNKLIPENLRAIPELKKNPLCDEIIYAFFKPSPTREIDFMQFVTILAIFRTTPTSWSLESGRRSRLRQEKLQFAYRVLDQDHDGTIIENEDEDEKDDLQKTMQKLIPDISEERLTTACIDIYEEVNGVTREEEEFEILKINFDQYVNAVGNEDIDIKMSVPFLKFTK